MTSMAKPIFQTIDFFGKDAKSSQAITGTDIKIIQSLGQHEIGSSQVKMKNMVDYVWEERFYTGQLLAVHIGGKYLAYGIKAKTSTGVIRVINSETSARVLIRGMEGLVQDIAFAHIMNHVILASVDEKGNLFIHRVLESKDSETALESELLLHVIQDSDLDYCGPHRVIWCPFIPDDDTKSPGEIIEDVSTLLVLTRGTKAELWNVGMVQNAHGVGPVKPSTVTEGYLEINEHSACIVDAAFSPDGTAIATAALDGEIKFFQVYMANSTKPRCLHQWVPHDKKPLSSLFFLDNHKSYNPEIQFWKFVITGAENNSELKVWSCETWTCLQTINFVSSTNSKLQLKASVDLAANYLVLSDIQLKVLYVFEIFMNCKKTTTFLISVSEFTVPTAVLSFDIVDAGKKKVKADSTFVLDDLCNGNGDLEECEGDENTVVVVRMYLVQPKSLQDCHIIFPPVSNEPETSNVLCSLSQEDFLPKEEDPTLPAVDISEQVIQSAQDFTSANHTSGQALNLMTPDAFAAPVKPETCSLSQSPPDFVKQEEVREKLNQLLASASSPTSQLKEASVVNNETAPDYPHYASGGSSPSREVQEIMLPLTSSQCYFPKAKPPQPDNYTKESKFPEDYVKESKFSEANVIKFKPSNLSSFQGMCEVDISDSNRSISNRRRDSDLGLNTSSKDVDQMSKTLQKLEAAVNNMTLTNNALVQTMIDHQTEYKEYMQDLKEEIARIEGVVTRGTQQQIVALSREERQNTETVVTAISQVVDNIVSNKLEDIVANEISNAILPAILNVLQPFKDEMHLELTKKLSATDSLLKENISKMMTSKGVMEVLSNSLMVSLTPAINQCIHDIFTAIGLPTIEKTCQTMFSQVNNAFSKGVKEYANILDQHSRDSLNLSSESASQIKASTEVMKTGFQQMTMELKKSLAKLEVSLNDSIMKGLQSQQMTLQECVVNTVRSSRAVTPVVDLNQHLLHLVQQNQINSAFQQALNANDLSLVVLVCSKVDPDKVFMSTSCLLQPPVLLSLVQQLSADMTLNTDIKILYLEKAVSYFGAIQNTPQWDALSAAPVLLKNLSIQLHQFITNNSSHKLASTMRMILMAIKTLIP
ncbi:unnamed protein product [Bemisia tabaci]|uniref:Enhancer of mRNA-decapping protein 4 WD40 repeat region domain-containing protein n=1 Tax=Bemisia tabaci TaxID=7038 RepID=A0A9P0C982_BEMTA|nr:unnamed protein product [Bemisia tabaci]